MIGYEYIQENGFVWRKHFGALIPLSMPHVESEQKKKAVQKTLKSSSTLFARWDCGFDSKEESKWWHIIKDQREDIHNLSSNTRNQIRNGSKKYNASLVTTDIIKSECYFIYRTAFESYETFEKLLSRESFERAIDNLSEDTEFWGVFETSTNDLVGFSENIARDDACFYLSIWLLPDAMKKYAGYVLIHQMNKHYLNEKNCLYVSDGSRSISHDTRVHDFLQSKFGFRKAYSSLNIVYRPWFGALVWILFPLRFLLKRLPSRFFKKVSIVLFQEEIRRSCKKGYNS